MAKIPLIGEGRKYYFYDLEENKVYYGLADYHLEGKKGVKLSINLLATISIFGYILVKPFNEIRLLEDFSIVNKVLMIASIAFLCFLLSFFGTKLWLKKISMKTKISDNTVYLAANSKEILIKTYNTYIALYKFIYSLLLVSILMLGITVMTKNLVFLFMSLIIIMLFGMCTSFVYTSNRVNGIDSLLKISDAKRILIKLKREGVF
ncbi:hypothetical protein A5804_000077 [Enterococcus faecium]|uniref:DUF443 family protein n=1 Tax=Enterococcus faecium TaxID=1352 RepID=A0AB73PRM2_ENTFC|nr:hypothetical protein [Enterococcus faecium]OTN98594.1 hypothetical protein A5804_000077 [Enterococcus faecium]